MRIALIGTRGVPARYGGFETCVEEVGSRLAAAGHEVIVYCRPSGGDEQPLASYKGMRLIHLPIVRKRSLETLAHTGLSVWHPSLARCDAAIVFNAANAPLLPVIRARGIPVATHVDGLEWQRGKWGAMGRRYYRAAEALAVRWSDALIADARGIADYYATEFGARTELIAYGAPMTEASDADRVADLDLSPGKYHLVVARFEPENHVLEAVQGYVASNAELPLVVVGSAPYADAYTARIRDAADERVRFLGSVWDQDQLNQLYAHALSYVHGHSVGGTNPSLLRAAGAGAFTLAWDVSFNREVIGDDGAYWSSPDQLAERFAEAEGDPHRAHVLGAALRRGIVRYNWDDVAAAYERLCARLAAREQPRTRPSGRRAAVGAPAPVGESASTP